MEEYASQQYYNASIEPIAKNTRYIRMGLRLLKLVGIDLNKKDREYFKNLFNKVFNSSPKYNLLWTTCEVFAYSLTEDRNECNEKEDSFLTKVSDLGIRSELEDSDNLEGILRRAKLKRTAA